MLKPHEVQKNPQKKMANIGRYLPVRSEEEAAELHQGINYVEDQLPASLEFRETQRLFAIIYRLRATNKYPVLEVHPGIGASSLVFASEIGVRILRLKLIENDPRLEVILEKNLLHYGFFSNESIIRNIQRDKYFPGVSADYTGGIGIFHPFINFREPIVGASTESAPGAGQSWMDRQIFIGTAPNKPLASLSDIIEKIRNSLQMALFILPLGFPDMAPDPALYREWVPMGTFQVLVIIPQVGYGTAKMLRDLGDRLATKDKAEKDIFLLDRNILTELNESNRVKGYPEINISEFLSPKFVPIWFRAAIHKDVDKDNNYETLEAYGDRVLKGAWATLMVENYPKITPNELNLSGDLYMSKRMQPELAKKLGLLNTALYIEGTDLLKLREDLFESFVGALATVSNYVEGTGAGMIRAYQFLAYLFPTVPALTDLQPESTRVKEILEAMWFNWEIDKSAGYGRFFLRIPKSMEEFLRREGRTLPDDRILASVTAPDWDKAKQPLFAKALKTLTEYKITKEEMAKWAAKYRIETSAFATTINVAALQQKMAARRAINLYWQIYNGPSGSVLGSLWEVIQQDRKDKRGQIKKAGQSSNFRNKVVDVQIPYDPITRVMKTDQASLLHSLLTGYLGGEVAMQPPNRRRE